MKPVVFNAPRMRVARVLTNLSCNQNCAFCTSRAPGDDRAFVAPAAVRERIDDAFDSGAETIIFTGGEPTMRRDLASLVAHTKERGARRVELETNASLIDEGFAEALTVAGLDVVRAHIPSWGPALDAITRDPGGWSATLRGLSAAARAGLRLEASAPVVTTTADTLPLLPASLASSGIEFEALVLNVPLESPDPALLVPLRRAALAIERTEAACRRADVALRVDQHTPVPPCLFTHPTKVAHLFSLTRGGGPRPGWSHASVCASCVVRDRCPGFPETAHGSAAADDARPVEKERVRRRLSIISTVEEQVRRELYQEDIERTVDGSCIPSRIVRVNFRCNQACEFCFVSTHLPSAEEHEIEQAILDIASRGGDLVLSGGEPTLNDRLVEYVRMGREAGARNIELQTNATRLADPSLTAALVEAGVDDFFVSLHGSRSETSDAVTQAPGTFAKTLAGVDELTKQNAHVRLNFVFCQLNLEEFPDYVGLVAQRWPSATVTTSFVAPSTDVVPHTTDLIPRYTDVMPSLSRGLSRAREMGVAVGGFESMCGIPLCLVPADITPFFRIADVPDGWDRGEFVKSSACERCDLGTKCFGVRRGYAELYGTDEFSPVSRSPYPRETAD